MQLEKELPILFNVVEDDLKLKLSVLFAIYFGEVLKKTFEEEVEWGSYYPLEPEKTELKIKNGESEATLRPVLAIKNCIYRGESLSKYLMSVENIVSSTNENA
jgi:hypothetical protein